MKRVVFWIFIQGKPNQGKQTDRHLISYTCSSLGTNAGFGIWGPRHCTTVEVGLR